MISVGQLVVVGTIGTSLSSLMSTKKMRLVHPYKNKGDTRVSSPNNHATKNQDRCVGRAVRKYAVKSIHYYHIKIVAFQVLKDLAARGEFSI